MTVELVHVQDIRYFLDGYLCQVSLTSTYPRQSQDKNSKYKQNNTAFIVTVLQCMLTQ